LLDHRVITILGLLVEVIGVAVIWRYGWPQPQLEGGANLGLEDATSMPDGTTAGQVRDDATRRRATYRKRSASGFFVLVLGLLIQAGAQLLAPPA
jgi:hypothetical protein